jgi:uncharacterized membrane-anchored protein
MRTTTRQMLNKVPEVTLYFWVIKIMCTTVGETAADYLNDNLGFGLTWTTVVTGVLLAVLLGVQFRSQRYVPPVYWLAILFTFALGTAAGDLFAEKLALGFWVSALIFGGAIALIAAAYFWLAIDAGLAFWLAYILTRPLGASIGDGLSQPSGNGGLGLGTTGTSYLFLACILALVAFLSFTKRDQTPAEVATSA